MPFDPINPAPLAKIELLDKILSIIDDATHWCKGTTLQHLPDGTDAYCIAGALHLAQFGYAVSDYPDDFMDEEIELRMDSIARKYGFGNYLNFNDSSEHTHRDIVAFLYEVRQSFIKEQNNAV